MSEQLPSTGPFTRFTDRANLVVLLAYSHARRLRRDVVDTEHLLLALTDMEISVSEMALKAIGVPLADVRRETAAQAVQGRREPDASIRPTAAAIAVLKRALPEAEALGHNYVGTEHLLIAMAAQADSVAAHVLAGFGVDAERLRAAVVRVLSGYSAGRSSHESTPQAIPAERRFGFPVELGTYDHDIAEAREQKDLAIEDGDFEPAAAWRDEEKRLLAARHKLIVSWGADIGVAALVDEIGRLYRQADRLRDLLTQHGIPIDDNDLAERAAAGRPPRRPAPTLPTKA